MEQTSDGRGGGGGCCCSASGGGVMFVSSESNINPVVGRPR